ncbi:hypothetical protein D9M68_754680 [compost metagenome]
MNDRLPHPQLLLALAALRDRALAADSLNALAFSIANDPYPLLRYHQALVLAQRGAEHQVRIIHGMPQPNAWSGLATFAFLCRRRG